MWRNSTPFAHASIDSEVTNWYKYHDFYFCLAKVGNIDRKKEKKYIEMAVVYIPLSYYVITIILFVFAGI